MNSNGKEQNSQVNPFEGEEIKFPVTFQLKAVMVGTGKDDTHKSELEGVFTKQKVAFEYLDKKESSKGAYTSFTYQVTLDNRIQMDALYADLKKIKELKFAV